MDSAKEEMFNQVLWDDPEVDNKSFSYKENKLFGMELFEYAGTPWSIEKLNQQLLSHPYVFSKMNRMSFREGDIIADYCEMWRLQDNAIIKVLTRWNVKVYEEMWKDVYKSKTYLASIRKDNKQIKNQENWIEFMNPRIDSFQNSILIKLK